MLKSIKVRKDLEKKILKSKLILFPFPHIEINNFFPKEVYKQIIKYNLFKKIMELSGLKKKTAINLSQQHL